MGTFINLIDGGISISYGAMFVISMIFNAYLMFQLHRKFK